MSPVTTTNFDNNQSLALKMAQNFYYLAVNSGISGLNAPSVSDPVEILYRKSSYYTAALVDKL